MTPGAGLDPAGFTVVRGAVPRALCEEVRSSLAWFAAAPGGSRSRLQDAWRKSDPVSRLACEPGILGRLEHLYGRRPIPFQTLNFVRGTEQPLHADSVHFDSLPPGWMCGVWVALEDVGVDQGPLVVVPGSHRRSSETAREALLDDTFDMVRYESGLAREVEGWETQSFEASAGDALIWHADLVHGGATVVDGRSTRWSQVTHYFFEGFAYTTPLLGAGRRGEVYLRDPLVDISTGAVVEHRLDGRPARSVRVRGGRTMLVEPGRRVQQRQALVSSLRGLWRHSKLAAHRIRREGGPG